MSPYAHMRLWLSTAFLQWSFSQYLFPSILNTWLQYSPFSWTMHFASKQNWVRAVNIQSMKFDRKEFEYSQTISKPKWLLLVLKTIQLITVISLKTYLLILVLLFLLYSVLDLCQELAEPVSIHPLEPCQEGRRTISILPMRKQWLDDVSNTFEFGFICLTPQSLILNYSKRFLSFPNFTGPKGERHMVWFRGYLKDCPSALKIPLLQEGFSGKPWTLGP